MSDSARQFSRLALAVELFFREMGPKSHSFVALLGIMKVY